MANIVGIVDKPQFDTNVFHVGMPVHIIKVDSNKYQKMNTHGIIGKSEPLNLRIWIYTKSDADFDYIDIPIDKVVIGEYSLSLMKDVG